MSTTTAPIATEMPTFVNTVYPNQRVTLTLIDAGVDRRHVQLHPTAQFVPQKVGMREEGERQVPIIHGFWTPKNEAELAAMRHVCDLGYCSAREESASLRSARELLQAEEARQAAQMGGRVVRYQYRCGHCGDTEIVKPMAEASRLEECPACGSAMRRVYTAPITDCVSYGKNMFYERTPEWRWKPKNEDQARQFRDLGHAGGHVTQFGAGRSTGS